MITYYNLRKSVRSQSELRTQREVQAAHRELFNAGSARSTTTVSKKTYRVSPCMCADQAGWPRTGFKPVQINPVGQIRGSRGEHSRAHTTTPPLYPGSLAPTAKPISRSAGQNRRTTPHHTTAPRTGTSTGRVLCFSDTILCFTPGRT